MFTKLTRRSTHVKPVHANNAATKWLVVDQSPLEAFVDELRRYGLKVALHNLMREMR